MKSKLQSVSFFSLYSEKPSMTVSISAENGMSVQKSIDSADTARVIQLIFEIVLGKKDEIAADIAALEAPLLITSQDKVIDEKEECPF